MPLVEAAAALVADVRAATEPAGLPVLVAPLVEVRDPRHATAVCLREAFKENRGEEHDTAEADDEREWVPNPRQKSHAMPLEVDDALFETWAGVLGDVERLLKGQEGVSVAELAQLDDHPLERPPGGFIDVDAFLTQPRDLIVGRNELKQSDPGALSELLGRVLGPAYKTSLPPSPLISRLQRMSNEIDRGEDTLERKLRYLLWLN